MPDDGTVVGGVVSDRMVEYSGSPGASALASLAKWAGVSLDEAREYARHQQADRGDEDGSWQTSPRRSPRSSTE
jgi:hypothetical protein